MYSKIPPDENHPGYKTELLARLGEAALEALDAATGIDQLLLAGVEGMALAADFDVDLRLGVTGVDHVAAGKVMVQST